MQQAQRGQQQYFIVSSHEPDKAGDQATGSHLVLVFLVDGQLLQEGGAQDEQLYIAAVEHLHQIHYYALQGKNG